MNRLKKIRNLVEVFLIFSFGGWIYESIWCSMIEQNQGFVNRGFLFGPWIPIYGFGILAAFYVFRKLRVSGGGMIFLVGALVSTVLELLGSYAMELVTGSFLWDYSDCFMNFQGRIALQPDLYFGFLILFAYYVVYPRVAVLQEKFDDSPARNGLTILCVGLFVADIIAKII